MTAFHITPTLRFVSRSGWGASAKYPRLGHTVARHLRSHVFVHHTVMIDRGDATKNVWEGDDEIFANMRTLQTVRGKDLGYDVPYSFVVYITPTETVVCEGRGEDRTGAHSVGHNTRAIGCSFAGDFENHEIEQALLDRAMLDLSHFLGWLKYDASHPEYGDYEPMKNLGTRQPSAGRRVFAHTDIKATACPGKRLLGALKAVDFTKPPAITQCPAGDL